MQEDQSRLSTTIFPEFQNPNELTGFSLKGEGTYGKVYDLENGVVVKVIKKEKSYEEKQLIRREILILESLKGDERFVEYYGMKQEDKTYLLFFKKYQSNLRTFMENKRSSLKVNINFGVKVFLECLFSLSHLHKKNIIHRDIKPENILIDCRETKTFIKIIDFGTSKKIQNKMTKMLGTSIYLAPEMTIWSSEDHNPIFNDKVDIWSLGITISELYLSSLAKDENYNEDYLYNPFKENLTRTQDNVKLFYQQYIYNEISLPKIMPSFLKAIVRKMLVPTAKERISFEEIYHSILQNWQTISQFVEDPQQTLKDLGFCQQIEIKRKGLMTYLNEKSEKMTKLFFLLYLPFKKKINLEEKHHESLLKFVYMVGRNIKKIRKEILEDWEPENIYIQGHMIQMEDYQKYIEILLFQVGKNVKEEKSIRQVFRLFLEGKMPIVSEFIQKNLNCLEVDIPLIIQECIFKK